MAKGTLEVDQSKAIYGFRQYMVSNIAIHRVYDINKRFKMLTQKNEI